MKVLSKKVFKLPYVDGQTYRELMRLGLGYDKSLRSYSAEQLDEGQVGAVLSLLSKILHEQVCFDLSVKDVQGGRVSQTCLICGKSFACDDCRYFELCKTKNIASICVCRKCLEEGETV
jgi:hypothetical protein